MNKPAPTGYYVEAINLNPDSLDEQILMKLDQEEFGKQYTDVSPTE